MFLTVFGHDAATWTAWGTWAYTVFTLALAVGAFWAIKVARKQLGALKDQIGQDADATGEQLSLLRQQVQLSSRQAAALWTGMRPLVVPTSVTAGPPVNGTVNLRVRLENVGLGPAQKIEAHCWVVASGVDITNPAERLAFNAGVDAIVRGPRHGRVETRALGAGATGEGWVVTDQQAALAQPHGRRLIALVTVVCCDMSGGQWMFPPSGEPELLLVQQP